jgi:hypothetical protein
MWMLDPNWPYGGEIDIIEGLNNNVDNLISLHTYVIWDAGMKGGIETDKVIDHRVARWTQMLGNWEARHRRSVIRT